ncbi:MAG: hypothetical protein IJY67_10970, partial [Paludibacteraceae bacterium]|nr:hypothetical protein [Paludibacteraceae bacterium]
MSKKLQLVGAIKIPQSDWNQTDDTKNDYIKNKPEIPSTEGLATEDYVDEKHQEALEVAQGKTQTFTIADLVALGAIFSIDTTTVSDEYPITTTEITYNEQTYTTKQGDLFLIVDTSVPDYWVSIDDMRLYKMETTKVDLTEYAKSEEVVQSHKTESSKYYHL